MLYALNPG